MFKLVTQLRSGVAAGEEVVRYWDALTEIDKRALAQEAYVRHVCLTMNDAFQSISSSQVLPLLHFAVLRRMKARKLLHPSAFYMQHVCRLDWTLTPVSFSLLGVFAIHWYLILSSMFGASRLLLSSCSRHF